MPSRRGSPTSLLPWSSLAWTGSDLALPGSDRSVDLGGRGLQLLPSALWTGPPLIGSWAGRWTLVYRSAAAPGPAGLGTGRAGALGALLGHSRAAVLAGARDGVSTSDLARRAGISVASASEHAGTPRRAGLIVTERPASRYGTRPRRWASRCWKAPGTHIPVRPGLISGRGRRW